MLASIHLNSNKPKNLKLFFDSYENNASDPSCFEIIVNIDADDIETKEYLDNEIRNRKFILKYISEHQGGYFSGHINANRVLKEANKDAYFIANVSDRAQVSTKNWDVILKKYVNYFNDDIFRVNCSSYMTRRYFDFWECCFAPSNAFFITKKFLELSEDWTPCFSHDAFQQCIMYYIEKHDSFCAKQYNRDIPGIEFLFTGSKPEEKSDADNYERISGQIKAWNILISAKVQREAKRRAMLAKANIVNYNKIDDCKIYDDGRNICVITQDSSKVENIKYSYGVNYIKIFITNFYRKFSYLNYCGGGFYESKHKLIFSIMWYLNFRFRCLRGIKDFYNKYFTNILG
tara:strand:+ start:767 stop:1804 length:1038 start_codon:yes stop_codon:yes gene_type:complete